MLWMLQRIIPGRMKAGRKPGCASRSPRHPTAERSARAEPGRRLRQGLPWRCPTSGGRRGGCARFGPPLPRFFKRWPEEILRWGPCRPSRCHKPRYPRPPFRWVVAPAVPGAQQRSRHSGKPPSTSPSQCAMLWGRGWRRCVRPSGRHSRPFPAPSRNPKQGGWRMVRCRTAQRAQQRSMQKATLWLGVPAVRAQLPRSTRVRQSGAGTLGLRGAVLPRTRVLQQAQTLRLARYRMLTLRSR